jgi:AcrR family transcriptional regulator
MSSDATTRHDRPRNARGEGDRLRQEIVTAAHRLLDSGATVTLRAIAREAGIAAPSIYRHYTDLDAVMYDVIGDSYAELTAVLQDRAASAADPAGAIFAIAQTYLEFAERRPERYRTMFGGVWNAAEAIDARPDADHYGRVGMEAFELLVSVVEDCVRAGSSTSTDPEKDAAEVWVALHGLADLRRSAPMFPWPVDIAHDTVARLARLT